MTHNAKPRDGSTTYALIKQLRGGIPPARLMETIRQYLAEPGADPQLRALFRQRLEEALAAEPSSSMLTTAEKYRRDQERAGRAASTEGRRSALEDAAEEMAEYIEARAIAHGVTTLYDETGHATPEFLKGLREIGEEFVADWMERGGEAPPSEPPTTTTGDTE